jgi:predicted negative regulator of RcsB-dependent stress response
MKNEDEDSHEVLKWAMLGSVILIAIVAMAMFGMPQYNVYQQRKEGEAQLAGAQYSRQIAVAEANAKMEAATLLAQAEVARAKGVAQANQIIGESLKNNEAYLRYLWITDVAGNNAEKTVVYVPTEANLPILEATRNQK